MFNTGYYSYETPYIPDFEGLANYQGTFIHPQDWTPDINYANKKIVVIGSGATAATLIPALIQGGASNVTMLQRSPTYFISRPKTRDTDMYTMLKPYVGESLAYSAKRWQSILFTMLTYVLAQKYPDRAKKLVVSEIRKQCPVDFDVNTHFNPSYGVWDQRLCLVPDGDFFTNLHQGTAGKVLKYQNSRKERASARSMEIWKSTCSSTFLLPPPFLSNLFSLASPCNLLLFYNNSDIFFFNVCKYIRLFYTLYYCFLIYFIV